MEALKYPVRMKLRNILLQTQRWDQNVLCEIVWNLLKEINTK